MKFLVISLSVLAVVVLVHSKAISEEVEPSAEDSPVQVQEFVETAGIPLDADIERVAAEGFAVPISRSCDNPTCRSICNALGFSKGVCISATTCQCSN